jgi:hypothetical protein
MFTTNPVPAFYTQGTYIRVCAPQNLPGIYLLVSNVLTIVLGQNPYIIIQFGFFVSWVYLRFFKLSENGEFRGDRSETFAFVNWFPPLVRCVLGAKH